MKSHLYYLPPPSLVSKLLRELNRAQSRMGSSSNGFSAPSGVAKVKMCRKPQSWHTLVLVEQFGKSRASCYSQSACFRRFCSQTSMLPRVILNAPVFAGYFCGFRKAICPSFSTLSSGIVVYLCVANHHGPLAHPRYVVKTIEERKNKR
jgi:hypothetical protein